ncbi:MAG: mechanosensitive ion channel [Gammaproteobacteria bacterium]|nr:mechanosensitive ion channel [Pseudomonadales bacterium]MCP5348510.1 mechanosensitive ion channel [Pseudomonadales bacterium]
MDQELEQVTRIYNLIEEYLVTYSFQIIGAILILLVGLFIARKVGNGIFSLSQRKHLDVTLSRFFASVARIAIIAAVLMVALPKLGIQITPFIAALGAVGLGAGLAVQGLLSNYSAGLAIILTRPFVVGDTIKVQGVAGLVKEVKLAATVLSNEDNELITIPNKHIVGEIIHNSQADSILELEVGIDYRSDVEKSVKVIEDALRGIDGISTDRAPLVGIHEFGDSAVTLGVRIWVLTEKLFETRYRCNLAIFQALATNGINIPFPRRDVHVTGQTGSGPEPDSLP